MRIFDPSRFAPPVATPFPHRVIHPAVEPSVFEELDRTFPDDEWFAASETVHGGRRDFAIETEGRRSAEFMRSSPCWARFWEEVAAPNTRQQVLHCFEGLLGERGYVGGDPAIPDFTFSLAGPGYELPVHHDKRYHIAFLLLYMKGHTPGSGGELALHRPLRPMPPEEHPRFPLGSDVERFHTIEPHANSACLVLNTADAYHSVTATRGTRRFVYVAWNVEQHSAWRLSPKTRWVSGDEFAKARCRRGFFEHS